MKEFSADDRLYLDDLQIGQRFTSGTHVVDEEQIKAFGRAAKRMTETAGHEAKTIHRLLEINPKNARSTAISSWSMKRRWST